MILGSFEKAKPCNNVINNKNINNDNYEYKLNTLTHATNTHLIEIIKIAYENGAMPDNSQTFTNTLSSAVRSNDLDIVRMLIGYGAQPDVSQTLTNTLTECIKMNNLLLIELLCNNNAKPDVSQTSTNTLTKCVMINNNSLVNLLCNYNALPNVSDTFSNTLTQAVLTFNPMIVKCIIKNGGKPSNPVHNYYYHYELGKTTFVCFIKEYLIAPVKIDYNIINEIINLMMCSGALVQSFLCILMITEALQIHMLEINYMNVVFCPIIHILFQNH